MGGGAVHEPPFRVLSSRQADDLQSQGRVAVGRADCWIGAGECVAIPHDPCVVKLIDVVSRSMRPEYSAYMGVKTAGRPRLACRTG